MGDEDRILELVERVLDSHSTAEEVCADVPELLGPVRLRLERLRRIKGQIEDLFPSTVAATSVSSTQRTNGGTAFPQITGYEIETVLGRGGMGIVYRAHHQKLNRAVALKMMLTGQYASPIEMLRFVREAEAIATLQHPNIVQVYDVGELDGKPYFTMEYLDGGSVAQNLQGTPWSTERSARLVSVLAYAVEFGHRHKIVHRDLKPANILLTKECVPKIVDFGLARRIDRTQELTQSGARIGTPCYMAPEQAKGQSNSACPAVDIYALGAILYELLTGRPPFRGETAAETVQHVIDLDPVAPSQLNPKIPRDLETICLKCLSKERAHRYSSAAMLADDLQRFLNGHPTLARPISWVGRMSRWCRRNPAAAVLWGTAVALTTSASFGGVWLAKQAAVKREEDARLMQENIQKIQSAMTQATVLQNQGRWPESAAVLKGTESLLDPRTPDPVRRQFSQAIANAEMVGQLEEIRLQLSDGRKTHDAAPLSPEELYSEAFQNYGLDLLGMEPVAVAANIEESGIREILISFLHDWLYWVSDKNRPLLLAVLDKADSNDWRRKFRIAYATRDRAKLRELAQDIEAESQPPVVLSGLGGALKGNGDRNEAMTLLVTAQQNHPQDFWINYLLGQFWFPDQPQIAVGYFRVAVAIRPTSDQAYAMLGRSLKDAGDGEGAIAAFRKVISLNPNQLVSKDLAALLAPKGELDETRDAWETFLERSPPEFEPWYGYAQLCLYLNRKEKYERARTTLLDRFGNVSSDWVIAERVGLACLLSTNDGMEFDRTLELINRAEVAAKRTDPAINPYITFVKGLADYRRGEFLAAIPKLQDAADQLTKRPGPRLVLAMAQHRAGMQSEARGNLAEAVTSYNWNPAQATHTTVWVSHILRREAETMILPDMSRFLKGTYLPGDNHERLALLGLCQSEGRKTACARLYTDIFAADPELADKLFGDVLDRLIKGAEPNREVLDAQNTASRYLAARCAAAAGSGAAPDAQDLEHADRERLRLRSIEWLRTDLTIWGQLLRGESPPKRDLARRMLLSWKDEPDFSGIREPTSLSKFATQEAIEYTSFWKQVDDVLRGATPR